MKLFLYTLLILPSLLMADPNMPSSVGYFYLAIYLGLAFGALAIVGVVLYIVKISFFKNSSIVSNNEQLQNSSLISSLKIFIIFSFVTLIMSVGVFYFPNYYFLIYFGNLNFWVFVLTLYTLKLVKHKYITISFIFVCIEIFIAIVLSLEIFEAQFEYELAELTFLGFLYMAKGLESFTLLFDVLLFPLIILAFKTLSEDEIYQKRLKVVLISFITWSIGAYAIFAFFKIQWLISILFLLISLGIILYFAQTVFIAFNKFEKGKSL